VAPGENDDEKSWFDLAILVYAPNLWIQFFVQFTLSRQG
jgi:hypothetical protein